MYPHRIQLRGPWEYEPLTRTILRDNGRVVAVDGEVPPPDRMTLPCRWSDSGLGEFAGRVRFRRRFQWPRGLAQHERLWLTCAGADYFSGFWLNGTLLGNHAGAFDRFEWEITTLVRERNELLVEVDCPAEGPDAQQRMMRGELGYGGGLWGAVALEVRRESHTRDLRVWTTIDDGLPRLTVAGELCSPAPGPLELYLLLDGQTCYYGRIQQGQFQVSLGCQGMTLWHPSAVGQPSLHELRIELIEGASHLEIRSLSIGFRCPMTDVPESAVTVLPLLWPAAAAPRLDQADVSGEAVVVRLPYCGGADLHVAGSTLDQLRNIVRELMHHPSVAAWQCLTDSADEDLVNELIRAVDPSRPVRTGAGHRPTP